MTKKTVTPEDRAAVEQHLDEIAVSNAQDEAESTDVTDLLSDDEIAELFAAFEDEDWAEVDRLIESFDLNGHYDLLEDKAGGADRNKGGAEKLRRYWTVGEGGAKIRWKEGGDYTRCVELVGKHLGVRARGYCALRHKEMNGYYPGDKRNLDDKSASSDENEVSSPYHGTKQDDPDLGEAVDIEHKCVAVKGLNVVDASQGIVETLVSVTGIVDNVKDRILPGAYEKTLVKRTPKGVWSHSWTEPISKTLEAKELTPGSPELPKVMPDGQPWPKGAGALKIKTQFNLETQRGREAYSDVVFFGDDQEWSIGYQVPVGGAKVDNATGVREISYLELYEYSPVLFGAMPMARTTSVKDAQMAFKTLMAEEAPVDDDEDAEVIADEEFGDDDLDDEADDEEKSILDGDNLMLVKSAIATLTDLLEAVTTEVKGDDMGDYEFKSGDMEDGEGDDYSSLEEAVEDICGDLDNVDEVKSLAADIDTAIKLVAEILADLIEQVSEDDGMGDGAPEEKGEQCPECGNPMDECDCRDAESEDDMVTKGDGVVIDTTAIDALRDFANEV